LFPLPIKGKFLSLPQYIPPWDSCCKVLCHLPFCLTPCGRSDCTLGPPR
jgi:hypothetical protein